jgi:hypothetical protein
MSIMRIAIVLIAAAIAVPHLRADLITYTFNDEGERYGFSGSMTIDTTRLSTNQWPGRVITLDSVVASNFEYSANSDNAQGSYQHVPLPLAPFSVNINPQNGAVLSTAMTGYDNGYIRFGPSPIVTGSPGHTFQVLWAVAELSTRYNMVGFRNFDILGAQFVAGQMESWSPTNHRYWSQFMSFGHWDVQITPIPAPPAWLLAGLGAVGFWRMRSQRQP